jgi:hypothetical protein
VRKGQVRRSKALGSTDRAGALPIHDARPMAGAIIPAYRLIIFPLHNEFWK